MIRQLSQLAAGLIAVGIGSSLALGQGVAEPEPVRVLKAFKQSAISMAVSKDDKRIAVLGIDDDVRTGGKGIPTVRLIDLKTERVINQLPSEIGAAVPLVYSPDGKQLTFGRKSPMVVNAMTGKQIGTLARANGAEALRNYYAYSPDSKFLWSFDDNTVFGYDMKTFREARVIPIKDATIHSIAVLPKRNLIAVGLSNTEVRLFPIGSKKPEPEIVLPAVKKTAGPEIEASGNTGVAIAFASSPDGKFLAISRNDQNVALWDLEEKKQVQEFRNTVFAINAIVVLGGRALVAGGEWPNGRSGSPRIVFDISTGKPLAYLNAKGMIDSKVEGKVPVSFSSFALQASADGKLLYAPCRDGSVQVFDVSEWSGDKAN